MKPKVYLETSFLSFLTARPTRDVVMAAMIAQSKEWWAMERDNFDLFVSNIVVSEAAAGDAVAARRRIDTLKQIEALEADAEAHTLAGVFLRGMALPPNAADDALHIAIAAVRQLDYLLTWNCRHIANAVVRPKLENLCLSKGFHCPIICTPPELRNIAK
jgi:hypothetical protein